MKPPVCTTPLDLPTLIAYWVGELDEVGSFAIEEHLLDCGECTATAQFVADVAGGIHTLVGQGVIRAVLSGDFLTRAMAQGLQVREYAVPRGGSVNCTIAPGDNLLVARLEAPLANVERIDLLMLDSHGKGLEHIEDIPFDPVAGSVVVAARASEVRALPKLTSRMQLIAVRPGPERVIGEYTFNHSPWGST